VTGAPSEKRPPGVRGDYRHFLDVPTRWADNDIYGHVNNVVYYAYFDTLVNRFLIEHGGLDIHSGPVIGIMAESGCRYLRAFTYPEIIQVGLRTGRLGRSSVRYELALFSPGEDAARAEGHMVHVFVDRVTQRPVEIPVHIRAALETLQITSAVSAPITRPELRPASLRA
jgi:acyl-CoA thioester hydrolase